MAKKANDPIKSLSSSQVAEEIKKIQDLLSMYKEGDHSLPKDFSYKNAIYTLRYLRLRQISHKKQIIKEVQNG